MKTIKIIDGRTATADQDFKEVLVSGRNFIVVLNDGEKELEELCGTIGCDPIGKPERLGRWGIHALNDVLEPGDYEKLLKLQSEGCGVYFVEQLRLKHNRPPKLKPYMVYCEVRGIISDHDSLEDAKTSFFHYLESFRRARLYLMVGIYYWQDTEWVRLKTVF